MLLPLLRRSSIWTSVPARTLEFSLRAEELLKKDKNLRKVNLVLNGYRDAQGKPFVFQSVKKAKEQILENSDHEYLPIEGFSEFVKQSQVLALGGTNPLIESRVAGIQTVGATGGLRLALGFIKRFLPKVSSIFIPRPSTYKFIIEESGLEAKEFTYYDPNNKQIDFELTLEEIEEAPRGSVFILPACGQDPTGIDFTPDQWKSIQDLLATKRHIAILDLSNQGLIAELEKDAFSTKLFANEENPLIVLQSFSRNLGLYGERIGCLSVVCDSPNEASNVLSQLKILARATYSNPPVFGSRVAASVLGKSDLKSLWVQDLKTVNERLVSVRKELVQVLREKGSVHDWSFLTKQKGIFAYSGLDPEICSELVDKHHVYVGLDGRISMAGINKFNIEYVAEALEMATRFVKKI